MTMTPQSRSAMGAAAPSATVRRPMSGLPLPRRWLIVKTAEPSVRAKEWGRTPEHRLHDAAAQAVTVTPARAGVRGGTGKAVDGWTAAFAGVTVGVAVDCHAGLRRLTRAEQRTKSSSRPSTQP